MYKVGDKVKIKSYDTLLKEYGGREKLLKTTIFVEGMQVYCGTEGIITEIDGVSQPVLMSNGYMWYSDMLEPAYIKSQQMLEELGFEMILNTRHKVSFINDKKEQDLELVVLYGNNIVEVAINRNNIDKYKDAIKQFYNDVSEGLYD